MRIPLSNSEQPATIDKIDYEKVKQYRWHLKRAAFCSYVVASVREGNCVRTVRLSRLIANPKPDEDVHHIDHNPLNNRRSNLECVNWKEHRSRRYESQKNS